MPETAKKTALSITEACLFWRRDQFAAIQAFLEKSPNCAPLPLSPIAFGTLLRAGQQAPPQLPYWNLQSKEQSARLQQKTNCVYKVWALGMQELHRSANGALAQMPLGEMDRLPLWFWSMELCHLDNMLNGLESVCPNLGLLHVANGENRALHNWHHPENLALLAALDRQRNNGWTVKVLSTLDAGASPAPPYPDVCFGIKSSRMDKTGKDWVLFHPLGLPELPHRLAAVARRENTQVVMILDEFFSGNLSEIYSIAAKMDNVHILPLFGAAFEQRFARAAKSINLQNPSTLIRNTFDRPSQRHLSTQLVNRQWPRHLALQNLFTELFDVVRPKSLICSDHASPEGVLLTRLAGKNSVPVHMLAHSGWPLDVNYALSPVAGELTYYGWTKQSGEALAARTAPEAQEQLKLRALPPRTIYPIYLRPWHIPTWIFRDQTHATIGIILTMEPFDFIPDIIDTLRKLMSPEVSPAQNPLNFVLRIREGVDDADMLKLLIADNVPGVRLTIVPSSKEAILKFCLRCQLVIEAGTPSSASIEAFAAMVPYVRLGRPQKQFQRFDFLKNLIPELNHSDPATDLKNFTDSRRKRMALGTRQHLWLLGQTATNWLGRIG